MCVPTYLYQCICVSVCEWEQESMMPSQAIRGVRPPGTGVTDNYEQTFGWCELNLDTMEKLSVFGRKISLHNGSCATEF